MRLYPCIAVVTPHRDKPSSDYLPTWSLQVDAGVSLTNVQYCVVSVYLSPGIIKLTLIFKTQTAK